MSDTIDIGIDLGTTNSVIAASRGGEVTVIKADGHWDLTPSAVWMPKRGRIHVGYKARNLVHEDPRNAVAEFKQKMGLADAGHTFVEAGQMLTPQELSAEVLKSLRSDAASTLDFAPDAAVITVPAAFGNNQNKATTDAARLAGFETCPLVKEPAAAAFAYGVHKSDEQAYWMVFDFGGGTFDAAVVRKHEDDLSVLANAGDPFLGGKLIDWAIVDHILAPAAGREYGLEDFVRGNDRWRPQFARLKGLAEEVKIHLSRWESTEFEIDLPGVGEGLEHTLRRDQMHALAEPYYLRAIAKCQEALSEASLRADDIDRMLLVGGVTLTPGLRELLADPRQGPGIELEWSLDPTVVVARGAAIHASTMRRPQRPPATIAPNEFAIDLAYQPRVTTRTPSVGGTVRTSGTVDWTSYSVTLSNSDARPPFHSGRIPLTAKGSFFTDLDLDSNTTSTFAIELTDSTGTPCQVTPNSVTITHGTVLPGVELAHSLGIQLAGQEFARILRKGTTLPVPGVTEAFRTSGPLRRDDPEAELRIPVVQGERSRGDRNRPVGMLRIQPTDVSMDLPVGARVDVTFEVDESNLVTVYADVPMLGTQFEVEANLEDVRPPDPEELQTMLGEAEERLTALRSSASIVGSSAATQLLDRIDQQRAVGIAREQVEAAKVDLGAAATAEERLRDLHAELDEVADAAVLPELTEELQGLIAAGSELIDQVGQPSDRREFAELRSRADDAIGSGSAAKVRAAVDRTGPFVVELEWRLPDFQQRLFVTLQTRVPRSSQSDLLFAEGYRAMDAGDEAALRSVNRRILDTLPEEARASIELERL